MTDNAAWEKRECERAGEHYRKQYPTAPYTEPGIAHRGGYINGFVDAKLQAVSDYDFAGQAVKDAARLERELADEIASHEMTKHSFDGFVEMSKIDEDAANERCAKAEAFLKSLGWDTADNCEASYEFLNEHATEACIAWRLTLPAEQKEADHD